MYIYSPHLLALESCKPAQEEYKQGELSGCHSPLKVEAWTKELSGHPDHFFSTYILKGITEGFHIGFNRRHFLRSSSKNMPTKNPNVITTYLEREVQLGRMHRHVVSSPEIHLSPLGAIPKKHKPGKWRLIMDLSSPAGSSVNDGISSEWSSTSYVSIDHLSSLVLEAGKGAVLVKADIKEAYRMLPIHPDDQNLLGVQWEGEYFTDRALPFGLRSAPKIFSAVADALHWILSNKGLKNLLHYLDDFIFVCKSGEDASANKQILLDTFTLLGVPLEPSKLEGPATCLTFLGIEVDSKTSQLRLPRDKLYRLKDQLTAAVSRKCLPQHELQSLTGLLQHATKVVRPGRPFLHRLYALQNVGSHPAHHIRLNAAARADITWWYLFVERWNGLSIAWDLKQCNPDITVHSDASGGWGCGAYSGNSWFQLEWPPQAKDFSIAIKELFPVVISAALFGKAWSGLLVEFRVDNIAVVQVLQSTYCKEPHLMHLIRLLVFFAAHYNFWFSASHIAGELNTEADALSRDNHSLFLSQVPNAAQKPASVPPQLVSLLTQNITWTCTAWMELFNTTLRQL